MYIIFVIKPFLATIDWLNDQMQSFRETEVCVCVFVCAITFFCAAIQSEKLAYKKGQHAAQIVFIAPFKSYVGSSIGR